MLGTPSLMRVPVSGLMRTSAVLIFVILGLVALYPLSGAFLNVETVMPIVREGFNFLGFQFTPDETEFITVKGLLVFPEIFAFLKLILEFYFGSQLAKAR